MNKITKISLSVIICFIVIALFLIMYFTIFNKPQIEFRLNTNSLVMEVGDRKDLKECYTVINGETNLISCFVNNLTFAEIVEDNILVAKSIGSTKISFKTNGKIDFEEGYINLTVVAKPLIPSVFTFTKTQVTMSLETEYVINEIVCSEDYNVEPTVTYSVNGICEYDVTTNKITPLKIGATIVTVSFTSKGVSISNNFQVLVEDNYRTFESDLTKDGDYYILSMQTNNYSNFELSVYENNIFANNIKLKFEFLENDCNATFIQYEANIVLLKATKSGEAILKIYCEDDPSVYELVKIMVV